MDPDTTPGTSYHDARAVALFRELDANPDLRIFSNYGVIAGYNPDFGLVERNGDQIVYLPISEFAMLGMGIGAAMDGTRVLVGVTFAAFMWYGWPAVVAEVPHVRYLSGGQVTAPVTIHITCGSRRGGGVQHEATPQAMLQGVPGLRMLAPSTPAEVDTAIHLALTGDDPTIIVDHVHLVDAVGDLPSAPATSLGTTLVRDGTDVLIVSYSFMVQHAMAVADRLADEGISIGVLSVPSLNPLPVREILSAVSRFEKLVIVDEAHYAGSCGATMMAHVLDAGLKVRARLVAAHAAPTPKALHLLDEVIPTQERIAAAARSLAT